MGSEEYEPDAKEFFDSEGGMATTQLKDHNYWANTYVPDFMKYYGATQENRVAMTAKMAMENGFNPYNYGYSWEVKVDTKGDPIVSKHYANGRMAYELVYAMPDRKTVYGTDDGTDVMFSKFVAKNAGDMSEGELFCARYIQTTPSAGGDANDFHATVSWISMGSASDEDIREGDFSIKKWNGTEEKTTFYHMWEVGEVADDGKSCKDDDFKIIKQGGMGTECLKLREDKWDEDRSEQIAILASRLEKRRYLRFEQSCVTLKRAPHAPKRGFTEALASPASGTPRTSAATRRAASGRASPTTLSDGSCTLPFRPSTRAWRLSGVPCVCVDALPHSRCASAT